MSHNDTDTIPSSAPELPHDLAKQYGLHEAQKAAALNPKPEHDHAEEVDGEKSVVDDPSTDAAVDDILLKEGDTLLESAGLGAPTANIRRPGRLRRLLGAWGRSKTVRWTMVFILLGSIGGALGIPKSRYYILNMAGVRSSASVIVLDESTQLPLKNVTVRIAGAVARTNREGRAVFQDMLLGPATLTIQRIAFAPQTKPVTIGWGSNPLGEYRLTAVGVQYRVQVQDYLSAKPIVGAEVQTDVVNALSDKDGQALLTVDDSARAAARLTVHISATGYRSEVITASPDDSTKLIVSLVPAAKEYFISKQSGTYDVYSVDLDGKNQKLLVKGTGNETSPVNLTVNPDGTQAALISNRDTVRSREGYPLTNLTLIDLSSGAHATVDRAEHIQPVMWSGPRLVYRTTTAEAGTAGNGRNRLISYNYETNARLELAMAAQFSVTTGVGEYVYFAAANAPDAVLGLWRIKPDGTKRQQLSDTEVWALLRTSYDQLSLQTPAGWYVHKVGESGVVSSSAPIPFVHTLFVDDVMGRRTVWTEMSGGKGLVMLRNKGDAAAQPVALAGQSGVTKSVRWAGDHAVVYRVATSNESASYVVSPAGGQPRKVTDIVQVSGLVQP